MRACSTTPRVCRTSASVWGTTSFRSEDHRAAGRRRAGGCAPAAAGGLGGLGAAGRRSAAVPRHARRCRLGWRRCGRRAFGAPVLVGGSSAGGPTRATAGHQCQRRPGGRRQRKPARRYAAGRCGPRLRGGGAGPRYGFKPTVMAARRSPADHRLAQYAFGAPHSGVWRPQSVGAWEVQLIVGCHVHDSNMNSRGYVRKRRIDAKIGDVGFLWVNSRGWGRSDA